jgi:ubiquinone/menaquinone biosynthesis C-methylase UbiE
MSEPEGSSQFVAVAPLYDVLMQGVPYMAWVLYLRQILGVWNANPRRVLDLACGTGNVTQLLYHEGYEVTGVDIAPAMIEAAQRKAVEEDLPISYVVQDAAELDLGGRRFDLCTCLFDSLNYVVEPERLHKAFERVYTHLSQGGLFVFDLNSEYALKNHFFDQQNHFTDEPLKYDWKSTFFPETRLCRIDMEFVWNGEKGEPLRFNETHWQYAYRQDEIMSMLERAGFGKREAYQAYSLRAPHKTTDRIFYVAQR